MLYELLLKYGFDLSAQVERRNLVGESVFVVGDTEMVVYLGSQFTQELGQAIEKMVRQGYVDRSPGGEPPPDSAKAG